MAKKNKTKKEKINKKEDKDLKEEQITDQKSEKEPVKEEELTEETIIENKITEEEPEVEVIDEFKVLQIKHSGLNDKYLRLSAEFDNYRKRTLKEKMELTKTAGEGIFVNLLPVIDNFERAITSLKDVKDVEAIKEGIELIYNRFKEFLTQHGIKEVDTENNIFDTDKHEAISKIPAPNKKLKGKIVDVIEKGYKLNNKVIRYSKVVIGE